jgi:hypothetical protein
MKDVVFWDVAPCRYCVNRLLQPPAHTGSSLADFCTLKMEATRSYETSVYTISIRRHIPEDGILHSVSLYPENYVKLSLWGKLVDFQY